MKPESLSLYIGGYMGSSYSVDMNRGTLLYTCRSDRSEGEEKHRIEPSPEAWAKFWSSLDELGFWSWSGSYQPSGIILDGTSWSVEISTGDRSVEAHGSNAYPPSDPDSESSQGSCEPESRFEEFCAAVTELLGRHEFS